VKSTCRDKWYNSGILHIGGEYCYVNLKGYREKPVRSLRGRGEGGGGDIDPEPDRDWRNREAVGAVVSLTAWKEDWRSKNIGTGLSRRYLQNEGGDRSRNREDASFRCQKRTSENLWP